MVFVILPPIDNSVFFGIKGDLYVNTTSFFIEFLLLIEVFFGFPLNINLVSFGMKISFDFISGLLY